MRRLAPVLLALLMLTNITALGQSVRGTLAGLIKDSNNAAIAGAKVLVKNTATGEEFRASTDSQGGFTITSLLPGKYSATVEATGFKRTEIAEIVVEVSQQAKVEVALEVGNVTEQVTVIGGVQEVINTSSPVLSKTINSKQVQDLPLLNRNPLDLARLQPGLSVNGTDVRNAAVQGLRGNATNVTQDGINAMDNFVKTSSFFAISAPSLNATSEFSITVGTVGSDAGRGVAQVSLVTPSGSNELHGNAFWQHRNDFFNANTFFNNAAGTPVNPKGTPRNILRQNFFGISSSGPVWLPKIYDGRNKSFWFFAYEGFREPFSRTRNRTVLTPAARTGIYRYNGLVNGQPVVQTVNLLSLGNFHSLNALTTAQLNAMPAPNNDTCPNSDQYNYSCFQWAPSGADPSDKYNARYDQQLIDSEKWGSHKLEFTLHRGNFLARPDIVTNALEAPFPGGVNGYQFSTRTLWSVAVHSTLGATKTNEWRLGRQYAPVQFLRDTAFTTPFINFGSSVTDLENRFLSQGRNTQLWQVIDNFSLVKGSHTFKMGGDVQIVRAVAFNDGGINQVINLGTNSANPDGLVTANFPNLPRNQDGTLTAAGTNIFNNARAIYRDLVGLLATSTKTLNATSPSSGFVPGATNSREYVYNDLSFFFQDAWRVKRNLTFNYGLRYDYAGVPSLPDGLGLQITNFNDIFGIGGPGNLFNPNSTAGNASATLDFVSGDTGRGLYNKDWNNFAPFVGFAYSPNFERGPLRWIFGPEGRSSIRGGFSISYLQDGITVVTNVIDTNPGLSTSTANNLPVGVLTSAGVPITAPAFKIPVTSAENFTANFNNGLWAADPNLRTPYVQQWSFGIEREISSNTAIEIRYAANHAVKIYRANDYNETNIFENGFLQEFLNAQKNLAARGGSSFAPGAPGTVPLPIFSTLFTGLSPTSGSGFASSTFISNLQQNNIGTMANTLAYSTTYAPGRRLLPPAFFVTNPNAAIARVTGNSSYSKYHSLQVELRRRFSGGLQFQANYTLARTLSDGVGSSQSANAAWRTLRDLRLDYRNAGQDQRHRFVANAVYDLPFGSGRRYLSNVWTPARKVIEGWTLGAICTYQTGSPFTFTSNRSTYNSFNPGNNPAQLVGMTFEEFKKNIGVFRTSDGTFFINPALLNITRNVNATTGAVTVSSKLKDGILGTPAPGTFGNFPINALFGPNFTQTDITLAKRTYFSERGNFEFRVIAFNIANHANFVYGGNVFDESSSFGKITNTTGIERQISFNLAINW